MPPEPSSANARQVGGPARRRKVLLRDVAALAEVSVASASQALRDGPVSEATRWRVLAAAEKLGYVPHLSARRLRTGRPASVAMWILNVPGARELTEDYSFFYAVIRGVLEELDAAGYAFDLRLAEASNASARLLATTAAAGAHSGFIVIPQWRFAGQYLGLLEDTGLPVVALNDADAPGSRVVVDNERGIEAAVDYLRRQGHERIAYLAGPSGHLDAERRLRSFYRVAAERGLRIPDGWVRTVGYTIDRGRSGMAELVAAAHLSGDGMPTAVLAANDYVAAGALHACADAGLTIPRDLSLVGYDDVDVARATVPTLTTVRQPLRDLGRKAAQAVLALAGGAGEVSVVLPTELIERESVAPA